MKKNSKIFPLHFIFLLLGLVVGYITGNSQTSVSVKVVSSLLGFMGLVVLMIIKGKENDERISKNLDTLEHIFGWFLSGMMFGIVFGSLLKGLYSKALQSKAPKFFLNFPPISHGVTNTKP